MPFDDSKHESHELTPSDAAAFIRKAPTGARFSVHIRGDAPITEKPGYVIRDAIRGYVNISRTDAVRLVGDMLSKSAIERGARIPLSVHTYESVSGKTVRCYWIG